MASFIRQLMFPVPLDLYSHFLKIFSGAFLYCILLLQSYLVGRNVCSLHLARMVYSVCPKHTLPVRTECGIYQHVSSQVILRNPQHVDSLLGQQVHCLIAFIYTNVLILAEVDYMYMYGIMTMPEDCFFESAVSIPGEGCGGSLWISGTSKED
jgi:uncharacterized membrane protein